MNTIEIVLKKIAGTAVIKNIGKNKVEIDGYTIHYRLKNYDKSFSSKFPFNINLNSINADFELWICGSDSSYYLVPIEKIESMYWHPMAYVDKHHPNIRALTVNNWNDEVIYASPSVKFDLKPYKNKGLSVSNNSNKENNLAIQDKLSLDVKVITPTDIENKEKITANTLEDIGELEEAMKDLTPKQKEKVSIFIERGLIAQKIKKVTNFKCLICEAKGLNSLGFPKLNGDFYIETHHVEPVSLLKNGSLRVANLLTVCANHHRQLHYGKVDLLENTNEYFKFNFDGKMLIINKIKI